MINVNKPPSKEFLLEYFVFDLENGIIYIKKPLASWQKIGQRAGSLTGKTGRRQVKMKSRRYYEYRLLYYIDTGEWPQQIDHIDGDPSNNKRNNLRPATSSLNNANRKKWKGVSSTYKGVCLDKNGKWRASYKGQTLGRFSTELEAHKAYCNVIEKMYGEFARYE